MSASDIVKQSAIDATNSIAAIIGVTPLPTNKVSNEAIAAYTSNAGPDANAWKELDKMCNKARVADLLLGTLKDVVRTVRIDFPKSASAIDEIISYAENEMK